MFTGSSLSSFHGENGLRSPCKGAVLPKFVSAAVSPMVRRSLGSLPSSLSHSAGLPSCASRQLVSPQITKWFRKSTPRKLAVTPKKLSSLTHEAKPSVAGVKRKLCSEPDTDDSLGVTQLAVRHKSKRPSRENDPKLSPSKLQRTEPSMAMNVLSSVESNCNKQLEQVLGKTSNVANVASIASNTAQSSTVGIARTSFCSPTVNLPNYVYDPQPRVPIGRHLSPVKCRQSRDWLTQLRLERQNTTVQLSPPASSPTGRGQMRRRTGKMSKSSPRINPSDASAVKAPTSKMSPLSTQAVSNYWLSSYFLCHINSFVLIGLIAKFAPMLQEMSKWAHCRLKAEII